jgi:hypothetical protein
LLALSVLPVACGGDVSPEARRELAAVERAIGELESAHPEDRGIRLAELEQLTCADPRVAGLKKLCVSSYRAFGEATGLLTEARAKTARAEAAITARGGGDAGTPLDDKARDDLVAASRAARDALSAVNDSLDRAEELIKACEARRASLRAAFTQR